MGSTVSGRFGDYKNNDHSRNAGSGDGDVAERGNGCPQAIENIKLEDVATSEFYKKHNNVPNQGMDVQIRDGHVSGRLVVELIGSQEVIGNLPTQYNNLLACIKQGMTYGGRIISSGTSPIPFVVVTLNAI